ncbi:universal stress protein [Flagellimonas sediminis]|uniref:Universal stress protein n=1 Tax=Flagellimonas sediminis TaxID=2696468 RepID=A0A6I5L3P1_9FLAO|nr:universal stress protein [Allomuricauda sediminis]NDV44738.1 universal stress protein [Allomuricauda sediminis]
MLQILVPTDFSNNSYNALYYAAKLFKSKECTFHLVNVCTSSAGNVSENEQVESVQGLDAMAHRLVLDLGKNSNHQIKKVSLCHSVTKGILGYAMEFPIDLMVIGNKAKEEGANILFGNNAMQLVREVNQCPVLIVPLEIDFKPVEKIAFVSNYVNAIAEENVRALLFFSNIMDSTLLPMSIEESKGTDSMAKHRAKFLKAISKNLSKEVVLPVFQDKVSTILEFVELWNIDMLCMVYYQHHFFLEFIGKGIIKDLNTKLTVPFLILPDRPK